MTALLFAAQNGDVDIIKLLLSRNASINVREGKYIFLCVDKSLNIYMSTYAFVLPYINRLDAIAYRKKAAL